MDNPFLSNTSQPLVALCGPRKGYLQIAPSQEITQYQDLPKSLFEAAQHWAIALEQLGAKRIYWITLSEAVPHLHIHLYPRWSEDEPKGLVLFEQRNTMPQPLWTDPVEQALVTWARRFQVMLLSNV